MYYSFFFFQAEDGIRDGHVTGVQTCALPILELPYAYSVQSSTLFSHGAIKILNALKIDSLSFGSESGNINNFINNFDILNNKEHEYNHILKQQLHKGLSYPVASNMAYKTIGFNLDVLEPNNILGFSY